MSEITKLPTSGDFQAWTPAERALVEAIGLKGAPRPTIEAFLHHCARTGLDPVARQIYAIKRWSKQHGEKWDIQVSIDGARLIAERSGQYRGQTAPQWTADGVTWVDVWISKEPPAAARVGVYREGFAEPMVAVATMDQYRPAGKAPLWEKMPALMVAKCAEALALRKAFPQDLSGLYTSEEMDQASEPMTATAKPMEPAQPEVPSSWSVDWRASAEACGTLEVLKRVWQECTEKQELNVAQDGVMARDVLIARSDALKAADTPAPAPVEDAEVIEDAELIEEVDDATPTTA